MSRKIASHYALINDRLERNIVVSVDDAGRIIAIEQAEAIDRMAGVEFYSGVLIPAMVNAHAHLELSYLHGAIAEGTGFAGFAREIGRVRGGYSEEKRCHAAAVADAQMWEEGVAAVADIANDELVMSIKQQSKIYYHTLFEFFGLNNTSLDELKAVALDHNATVTPHSTYSVQDAPFRSISELGEHPLSLHFLESEAEAELYEGRGSLAAWYERMGWQCDFLHYGSPAKRIVESIPASRSLMLVHACMATPEDVELLNNHFGDRVTWVLCPESNRYISSLRPPVEMLRAMGAHIAIGTDSLSSARHLSMVQNMALLGNDIPLAELLTWATRNGAQALGLGDKLGTIELGKSPGLAIIEGADLNKLQLTKETTSRRLL